MNRLKTIGSSFITVASVFLFVPLLVFFAPQARAEFKCDAPPSRLDRVACEKAADGPRALGQYIRRIRAIESLYFWDYVNEERARAWAQSEGERAADTSSAQAVTLTENPGA